jgi:hypothetical protein
MYAVHIVGGPLEVGRIVEVCIARLGEPRWKGIVRAMVRIAGRIGVGTVMASARIAVGTHAGDGRVQELCNSEEVGRGGVVVMRRRGIVVATASYSKKLLYLNLFPAVLHA